MKKTLFPIFLLILLSCNNAVKKKEEITIPSVKSNETKTEYITRKFSCNINEKVFNPVWETMATEPKNADIVFTTKNSQPYALITGLEITPNFVEQVTIGGFNINAIGKYDFKKSKLVAEYFYRYDKTKPEISISSTDEETFVKGSVNIAEFDTIQKKYVGEFSFVLFNPKKTKDTIKIENGKFYLKLKL